MEQLSLSVEKRAGTGKSVTRKLRALGKLPGVVYGLGKSVPITADPNIIRKLLLEEGGRNKILKLDGGELSGRAALIKDFQIDPLSRKLVHVDLLEIDIKAKITVTVTLNFVGKAIGTADGGILSPIEREVLVRCLPTAIPKHIDVDVTSLKIADSIHLDDLKLPEGVEKGTQFNPTLVTVVPPAKEEELAPSLAPAAEPEVITEKKAAAEDGEAAPAAGGDKGAAKAEKKDEKKK
jgi:large subunit ribosomal protein L25